MGAAVIATSSSDEKLDRVRALGADHTINYKAEPNWGEVVRQLTDGRGVDHVVEVGGPGTLPQSITAVRNGGGISLIWGASGGGGGGATAAPVGKRKRRARVFVGGP